KEEMEQILKEIMESSKVGISGYVRETSDHSCTFEVSLGDQYESITEDQLNSLFDMLNERMEIIKN
ncbi:MAG: low specificity L-threonine aldolase, partial [Planococcaceae bacterium]|nr:low specificity L-threonine aldolase [Planococcaceae bacterium]